LGVWTLLTFNLSRHPDGGRDDVQYYSILVLDLANRLEVNDV